MIIEFDYLVAYFQFLNKLNINDSGKVKEGGKEGGVAGNEEQASSYGLRIRVHNDLQQANRRFQIHTGRAVVLKRDITKQTT